MFSKLVLVLVAILCLNSGLAETHSTRFDDPSKRPYLEEPILPFEAFTAKESWEGETRQPLKVPKPCYLRVIRGGFENTEKKYISYYFSLSLKDKLPPPPPIPGISIPSTDFIVSKLTTSDQVTRNTKFVIALTVDRGPHFFYTDWNFKFSHGGKKVVIHAVDHFQNTNEISCEIPLS